MLKSIRLDSRNIFGATKHKSVISTGHQVGRVTTSRENNKKFCENLKTFVNTPNILWSPQKHCEKPKNSVKTSKILWKP